MNISLNRIAEQAQLAVKQLMVVTLVSVGLLSSYSANAQCTANFNHFADSTLNVSFNDTSTSPNPIVSWSWDFGDSTAFDSVPNPAHNYGTPGTYNVCLVIMDSIGCSDTFCAPVTVPFSPNLMADFNWNFTCIGDSTEFYDISNPGPNPIVSWNWDFGDSSSSTLQDPKHVFADTLGYNVQLIVTDSAGAMDTTMYMVFINNCGPPPCWANFDHFTDTTLNVTFTDSSNSPNPIVSWSWDFGDSTAFDSVPNPLHTYGAAGTYTVCLTIMDSTGCSDTFCLSVTVGGGGGLMSDFNWNYTCLGDSTEFYDISSGPNPITSWFWDFGDSTTSTMQDPIHVFADTLGYNVSLIVTDSTGAMDTNMYMVFINNCGPPPCWANYVYFADTTLTVTFTDSSNSPNPIVSWSWDFDDSTAIDSVPNPSHTYAAPGTYNVCLVIMDSTGCADTVCSPVTVPTGSGFLSDFNWNYTCLGDSTEFYDISTPGINPIVSWNWDFGDSSSSTLQDPKHVFADTLGYNVQLIITDSAGAMDTVMYTVVINTCGAPCYSDFNFFTDTTLTVSFTDTSGSPNPIVSWSWDFGDSTAFDSVPNPLHTYGAAGTYTVCLTIMDSTGCSDTFCLSVTVGGGGGLMSDFNWNYTCLGDSTEFYDISSGPNPITSWFWDFGDSTTSTMQDPIHVFADTLGYNVSLIVTDSTGAMDTNMYMVFINNCGPPPCWANFYHFTDTTLNVTFTDSSNSPNPIVSWSWDFGDSTAFDSVPNPSHNYGAAGTYTVCLAIMDSTGCADTFCMPITVGGGGGLMSDFNWNYTCLGDSTEFYDISSGPNPITSWFWDFGDSTTSTMQDPIHVFADTLGYNVSLIVTDSTGAMDTNMYMVFINNCGPPPCWANFYHFTDTTLNVTFTDSSNSPNPIVSWSWDFGDSTAIDSVPNPSHNYGAAGTYTVCLAIMDSTGCADTFCMPITVGGGGGLMSDFNWNYTCLGDSTEFYDISFGPNPITSWFWDFGDSTTSTMQDPIHVFADTLGYNVSLIVTDSTGAMDTNMFMVFINNCVCTLGASIAPYGATCNGGTDGSADLMVTGGTLPYTFLWSTAEMTEDIAGLVSGFYSVTVTDSTGCMVTDSVFIGEPAPLVVNLGPDTTVIGSVTLDAGAGFASYLWSTVQSTQTILVSTSGTYSVTVNDSAGCSGTDTIMVTVNPPAGPTAGAIGTDASCNGLCDGSAAGSAAGGTPPYMYLWNDGQSTATAINLCAGSYSVVVTDSLGMMDTAFVTIAEPAAISSSSSPTICNGDSMLIGGAYQTTSGFYIDTLVSSGGCDSVVTTNLTVGAPLFVNLGPDTTVTGSVTLDAGAGFTSYLWSTAQTTQTILVSTSGTYSVTVNDSAGCSGTDAIVVTVNPPLAPTAGAVGTDASCNGLCDGSAIGSATGGTPPYMYLWNDGQSTATAINLCAGSYSVVVTDSLGMMDTAFVTIAEPAVISSSSSPAICNGDSMFVGGAFQTASGVYIDSLLSGGGCDSVVTTNLTVGAPLFVNLGPDTTVTGSVTLDAGAGFTSYLWSTAETTQTILVSTSGTYSVTVNDSAGCSGTDAIVVTVNPPAGPTAGAIGTDASCNGLCDGSAAGSAAGGTPPYMYLWNDGQSTATAINLCAGSYSVVVTDSLGMMDTAFVTISEPGAISTSSSSTDASCNGQCTGTAMTTASGGTGGFTYSWSSGGTTSSVTGLCAGTETVMVMDSSGCSIMDSVTITEPLALTLSPSSVDATCGNSDGSATVGVTGGTSPFTYSWDNGAMQTTPTANALAAGSYSVVVTDDLGCTDSTIAIVNDAGAPSASISVSVDASCNGLSDGSATVSATGGTAPYTYLWDDPSAQTNTQASNLAGGTYTVLVTDASGCTAGVSATILEPSAIVTSISGTTVTACSTDDGTADLTISGGTSPYMISWSTGDSSLNVTGLTAGVHTVSITDANGCTAMDSVIIGQIPTISVSISGTNVTSCGLSDGTGTIVITGGAPPVSVLWDNGDTTLSVTGLGAGLHSVQVVDAMGCAGASTNILITEPPALVTSIVGTDLSSCGAGDGAADLTVTGGVAPFNYIWSTGDTTEDLTGLPAGTHSVTMIDANGCTASDVVTLTEPAAFTTSVAGTDVTCNLGSDGYADLTTTGGVAPFVYNWSNGDMLEDIGGIPAGTYYVDIMDANGCSAMDSVVITEPAAMVLTFTIQDATGCGTTDGSASVSVSGGAAPLGYVWSNGDTTSAASGFAPGTHYLTITDANGCIVYGTFNVNAVTGPSVSVDNVTDVTCADAANGSIDVSVTGGNPPYAYSWTHGATTEDVSGLQGTIYELTVTDSLGCVASASATVSEPASITVQTFTMDASCNAADGYAEIFVTGGVTPYTYQWSTFGTTTSQSGLAAGSYTLNVIDGNGCFTFTQISVNSLGGPTITLDSLNHVDCDFPSGGLIDLSISGGTAPYNYAWSTGDSTEDLFNLVDTNYSVVVTDMNGCSAADNFDIFYLPPQDVKICIITVDSATGKNLIVWEKPTGLSSIENYYVYKEHTQAGVYFLLGIVPFDSLSVFIDPDADPGQRSWRYKITAGDTCISGVESEKSVLHKTMHLTINQGLNGAINLIWDKYDGFFISTYVIYRGTNMGQMDSIAAVPSTINSYTDLNPPTGNLFYEVSAVHPQGCLAEKAKSYNSSKSNTSSITPSDAMTILISPQDASQGNCDGQATAAVQAGGQAPFTYLWDDPLAQTTATATDLCADNYGVIITDALGDQVSGSTVIGTLTSVLELNGEESISVFPNPYTGQTSISYNLLRETHVSLEVYDVLGKRVSVLANEAQQAGTYKYVFGAENHHNPNGVYFVKLIANNKLHTKRIIELK